MNVLAPPQKLLRFLHLSCFLLRDSHTRNDIFGSEAMFLTLKEGYLASSVGGSGFDGCVLGLIVAQRPPQVATALLLHVTL